MFITSNISFLKAQEYFNRISSLTSQVKNRRKVFKFVEGLYDLGLWEDIACWFLTTDKNVGISPNVFSIGGLGYTEHPCQYAQEEPLGYFDAIANNVDWNLCGTNFGGNQTSFIDTTLNPLSAGFSPNNISLVVEVIDPHYRPSTSEYGTVGAYESQQAKLGLDISELGPVRFYSSYKSETITTETSGSPGFWVASRTSANTVFIHKNGINQSITTNTTPAPHPVLDVLPDRNLYIGGYNSDNLLQNSFFSEQHLSFVAVLKGLTQQQAMDFYELYRTTIIDDVCLCDNRQPCIPLRATPTPTPTPTLTPTVTPTVTPTITVTPTPTQAIIASPTPTPSLPPKVIKYCLMGCEADHYGVVYLDAIYNDILYYTDGSGLEADSNRVVMYISVNNIIRADVIFHKSRLGMPFGYSLQGDNVHGARFIGVFTEGRVNFMSVNAILNPVIVECVPVPIPTPSSTPEPLPSPRCAPSPTPSPCPFRTPTPTPHC